MLNSLKSISFASVFFLLIITTVGCKKELLIVDEAKTFQEIDHVSKHRFDNGWSLTLKPDGTADILPGGDIYYRGTYKISGDNIKVKTEQGAGPFDFEIISETEIKEKQYGVRLALKK